MFNYLIDGSGALSGPVEFPVTPGIGIQLPANAIELSFKLPEPEAGRSWALINGVPREAIDRRGGVYRKDGGAQQIWTELGALPETLTSQPWPGELHVWRDNAGCWMSRLVCRASANSLSLTVMCCCAKPFCALHLFSTPKTSAMPVTKNNCNCSNGNSTASNSIASKSRAGFLTRSRGRLSPALP